MKKKYIWTCTALGMVLLWTMAGCNTTKKLEAGSLRAFPYPYRAMVAICSDIDGSTLREFEIVHRYLNTYEQTEWGNGLGLDIGDSFWMYTMNDALVSPDYLGNNSDAVMTYFLNPQGDYKYKELILQYFYAGWIDAMHTYGDFSRVDPQAPVFSVELAKNAMNEMQEHALLPTIWINHGNDANVQNFRANFKKDKLAYQQGATPDSPYYHADFTIPSGIKYVWFSEPSGEFGVDSPLYPVTLLDGQQVWGFERYTGEDKLLAHVYNWSPMYLKDQFTVERLNSLVKANQCAVVAQHFGSADTYWPLNEENALALRLLADYESRGDIIVARTSRLLEYIRIRDYLEYDYILNDGLETIHITGVADPVLGWEAADSACLQGITFYVEDAATAQIIMDGVLVDEAMLFRTEGAAFGDEQSVGFRWYEKNTTDYTQKLD